MNNPDDNSLQQSEVLLDEVDGQRVNKKIINRHTIINKLKADEVSERDTVLKTYKRKFAVVMVIAGLILTTTSLLNVMYSNADQMKYFSGINTLTKLGYSNSNVTRADSFSKDFLTSVWSSNRSTKLNASEIGG